MLSSCTARRILSLPQKESLLHRSFHATRKQEILPLVGAVAVVLVVRYSWKALRRMDDEWADYQWHLTEYDKQHTATTTSTLKMSTVGIDLGTVHMIWAHHDKKEATRTPQIVPTHEGGRYTFCGVVLSSASSDNDILVGQRALAKFYEVRHGSSKDTTRSSREVVAQWPYRLLQNHNSNNDETRNAILQALLRPPLRETLAKFEESTVRSVVAIPPTTFTKDASVLTNVFVNALNDNTTTTAATTTTTLIPEPVAAIWGAQQLALLPSSLPDPVLVLDVGGHTTTLAIVQKNIIICHATLPNSSCGGEVFLEELVKYVLEQFPQYRNDAMAVQRLYLAAESSMAELNTHQRTHLQIPYLGMDLETKQPQHLDMTVSRSVLEQRVQEKWLEQVIAGSDDDDELLLSRHMPPPTNLSSLWASIMTQLLERANMMPMQLSHLLLIGGGAKHPVVVKSVQEGVSMLFQSADKLVIPEVAVRSELVALGAASLLPNYTYEAERGLVRTAEE